MTMNIKIIKIKPSNITTLYSKCHYDERYLSVFSVMLSVFVLTALGWVLWRHFVNYKVTILKNG